MYDNVETTELSAEITWQKTEKLDFIFQAQYFSYRLENEFLPWYLPDYQLKTAFQYDILDKLLFRGQLFVISPRKAKTFNPSEGDFVAENVYSISLPAIYDINLGIEYRYSKKLSAFLNINNIASVKYYQWENYPVQGLNILGGIAFSFSED
jgi:outer membrane receptor protein involved in Fe transport